MHGAWGYPFVDQSDSVKVAYIVIPENFDPRSLDILVKVATNPPTDGFELHTADFFSIPEPATISLVGLALIGGLGLGRCRRNGLASDIQRRVRLPQ